MATGLAVMTVFGAGRAFWMPAGQAMTPNLVPVEAFPSAVALNSMLFEAGVITGPALGGVLYLVGPSVVYCSVAAMLIVSAVLIAGIKPVRPLAAGSPPGTSPLPRLQSSQTAELLHGLRYVLHHRALLGAISLDLFGVLFGGATALLPAYARDVLHVGPAGLGLLRTATGVGATATAVALVITPIERHVGRWMFAGVALFGVATVVFGYGWVVWARTCRRARGCGDAGGGRVVFEIVSGAVGDGSVSAQGAGRGGLDPWRGHCMGVQPGRSPSFCAIDSRLLAIG